MIKASNIKCPVNTVINRQYLAHKLKIKESDIISFTILRQSLDARSSQVLAQYAVALELHNEKHYLKNKDFEPYTPYVYELPVCTRNDVRPIVVGFGPSGMLAGLILAEAGMKPIIIERGGPVEQRIKDVDTFWKEKKLNPDCNVQFGEGGAGTFSDGKLTTRIKDDRVHKVLEEFIEAGCDEKIAYEANPHIGTDKLRDMVRNIRQKIIDLGGEIRFNTRMKDLHMEEGQLKGVITDEGLISGEYVILCLGHSAVDTISTLSSRITITPKNFAVGVRVEHPQSLIDQVQYHGHDLGEPASYHLTHTAQNGRGVYSFCMCPGGVVVPSASEEGTIVTNGMSYSDRALPNANSAILVQIFIDDYFHGDPLDGFAYIRDLERKVFELGEDYKASVQNISDFINDTDTDLVLTPSYAHGTVKRDMSDIFEPYVTEALKEGLLNFDKKIPGFIDQGIMTAAETRSSCPVRLLRNADCQSDIIPHLFPCGEGAGYAGGIISSAVDGIRCAEALIKAVNH